MEQVDLDHESGHSPGQCGDLVRCEGRHVPIDAHDRVPGREEPLRGRPLGAAGRRRRPLAEKVVERLAAALGDEPFGDDQPAAVRLRESVTHLETGVPGMSGR
jgi:hypothetical protein